MHSLFRGRIGMLAVGSLVLAGLGAPGAFAGEPTTTSVVTDAAGWDTQAYENFDTGAWLTPQQADVDGPQRAPFGSSSHLITIGESTVQTELYRTSRYDGVKLANITRLAYSTLARRAAGSPPEDRQPTYLRLSIDNNADGVLDDTLYFFPANNADQNAPANGVWQSWDVAGGLVSVNGDNGLSDTVTLADYLATNADATLVNTRPDDELHPAGAIALVTGGALGGDQDPQVRGEFFVDRVIVGQDGLDTLFDFGGSSEQGGGTTALTADPNNLQGWYHQAYDNVNYLTSDQEFVDGPVASQTGGGSLRFALSDDTNPDRVELFRTTTYDGTLLRDVRTLGFSTFQRAAAGNATPQQPVYLRLSLDGDGDGVLDDTLFFAPANNGAVEQSSWQTWDAANGVWFVNQDLGPNAGVTLDNYLVAHPDATIVKNADGELPGGGMAFLVGAGGAAQMNGEYFLDDISIGTVDGPTGHSDTTTDFALEAIAPAVSIRNARVLEGNRGATLTFPVRLSSSSSRAVNVHYATSNGTAKAGTDYRATSGTLVIPAGATSANVRVNVLSDKLREATKTMTVTLSSPVFVTLAHGMATGTIVNDDARVGLTLTRATEHRVRAYVDTLSAASGAPVKVYRISKTGRTLVLSTQLSRLGRVTKVLSHQYRPGVEVSFYATVRTAHGLYTSALTSITVRR